MWCSYGNIDFTTLISPDSFSHTDETEYAQHDLINIKPVLQPAANALETYDISLSLHAEFCNVEDTISQLKTYKDSFSAEPLLMGNGEYKGDFVITSLNTEYVETFDDGTISRATVAINLKEYQVADKLAQQQNAARKNAFAVGNKTPVVTGLVQPATIPQNASVNMASVNSESDNINNAVSQYADNVSQQNFLQSQIKNSLTNINSNLDAFNNQFQNFQYLFSDVSGVQNAVAGVAASVTGFSFTNLAQIQSSNLNLQSANLTLQTAITPLNYNIIDRRA
jgi:phage protein U